MIRSLNLSTKLEHKPDDDPNYGGEAIEVIGVVETAEIG